MISDIKAFLKHETNQYLKGFIKVYIVCPPLVLSIREKKPTPSPPAIRNSLHYIIYYLSNKVR